MKPLNAESHSRSESWVTRASTLIAPGSCLSLFSDFEFHFLIDFADFRF